MVDLFVVLGAAIVKASVKLWLKDNDFAADIGASLTDLISGRISGQYDQRKVRRIFEDLDETVGRRLESLRQTEFGRLPENEWNAAVIAAGISFDRSQLSAAELFTRDRDFRQRLPATGCNYLGTSPAGRVRRSTPRPERHVSVLFGATGDLTRRKLLPGLSTWRRPARRTPARSRRCGTWPRAG